MLLNLRLTNYANYQNKLISNVQGLIDVLGAKAGKDAAKGDRQVNFLNL